MLALTTLSSPLAATLAAAVFWAALAADAAAKEPRYRIRPLPQHMAAADINNLGEVAGTVKLGGGVTRGAVWRDGQLHWLASVPGDVRVTINALNDRGEVVGQAFGASPMFRPVLYRDGSVIELSAGFSSPPLFGDAIDINNAGVSTGLVQDGQDLAVRPFIHDGNKGRELEVASSLPVRGLDINDAGNVLLGYDQGDSGPMYLYWDGRLTELPRFGPPSTGIVTTYRAINNVGQALGNYYAFGGPTWNKWFLWRDGQAQFFEVPGGGSSAATAFNDQGWVVGAWIGHLGFVHRDGQTHALEDLLDPAVAGRWRGGAITGINEAGQLIGYGYFFNRSRAFVATPVPEPASAMLWLAGLGAVAGMARRRCGRDQNRP